MIRKVSFCLSSEKKTEGRTKFRLDEGREITLAISNLIISECSLIKEDGIEFFLALR